MKTGFSSCEFVYVLVYTYVHSYNRGIVWLARISDNGRKYQEEMGRNHQLSEPPEVLGSKGTVHHLVIHRQQLTTCMCLHTYYVVDMLRNM